MNATRPEAGTEYSRGPGPRPRPHSRFAEPGNAVAAGALTGALLLLAAEFTTLYSVHVATYLAPVRTVGTGPHHGFALIPVALLAVPLAAGPGRLRHRGASAALAALGLVALLIALLRDLPDTRAHGLTPRLVLAASSAGPGLYVETLGAVALLLAGGLGFVAARRATEHGEGRARRRPDPPYAGESEV